MSNLFKKVIKSNKDFWNNVNHIDDSDGYLLYEAFYLEPIMTYGITKTALTIAKIKGLTPVGIEPLRTSEENKKLIYSMNNNIIGNKFDFLVSAIKNIFSILKYTFKIRNKQNFLNLKVDKYEIGKHIYDHTLISYKIPEVNKIDLKIRKKILLELAYFFYFKDLIESKNIKMMVLGDNVYRYGLLFELAKYNKAECITPINLNAFSMRKYQNFEEFNIHDRKPEKNILDNLQIKSVNKYIDEYFSKRFSANLEQHDVLKAFSNSKKIYTKNEVIAQYNLKENLPVVIIMNHIFCDAPHAYPDGLYDDYKEWLTHTVKALKLNKNINFLIKEHPSADLYNEKGVINKILNELDSEQYLLKDDVHSLTVLNEFDVVITCGGTIGQEFIYKGKPVVLAAKPPYSGFGFTTEPKTKEDYERLLSCGVENLPLLSSEQRENANKVIYHDFVLLNSYSDDLEIGGERFYMGRDFDYEKFYDNILKYNEIPLENQKIYKLLKKFIESDDRHLLRNINE
ncbi:hypothetical protein [Sulfurimonas sp.]|uniref:capsular polysaccharide export protein, LipB/KpsS family n=1 Tax=Sulfurimonas sp. TaxID=2022749 RepID=UPI0019DC33D7|nr:hypothetical protein [Sulfurimonas sp.]MBE0514907.1 hypothetical protein [Sulfurimonas sp.]